MVDKTSPSSEGLSFFMEDLMNDDIDGDLIFSYTRRQAIEDGVLIVIPKLVDQPNIFKYQTASTIAVFSTLGKANMQAVFKRSLGSLL
jgi:hypothetical protein